ncbi:MAG: hypothetical protein HC868_16695 [Sphingomonadales bacterium]|nr:hypothetical protein [Sphingomonadales bacterium]
MEYETISGDEVQALMRGEKIVRATDDEETKGPAGPAVPAAGKSRPPRPEPGTAASSHTHRPRPRSRNRSGTARAETP